MEKENSENADLPCGTNFLSTDVFFKLAELGPTIPAPFVDIKMNGDLVEDSASDFHGKPASKSKTSNWKACFLIFGCERS
ncbi:hypothetical protein KP509_14G025300 [Ceratopteris richardii]|uniref:Uncharacterized protein n=1 Tax=Ceratopteris richardii TaxID=49495 RepID=A0A8T2TA96_CERRI|nr:hypothetical protein KP509_14G025300 [Ceratopteris richardii]